MPTITRSPKSRIYSLDEYERIKHPIPKSLLKAAGLLQDRRQQLEQHLRNVRREWGRKTIKT